MTARSFIPPAMLAAVIVVAVVIVTGGGDDYTVRAEFANASGLRTNSLVDIAGQPAGRVRDLTLTGGDKVMATLELDDDAGRIGRGATAKVRPANLLGEKYVDLNVGRASSSPLPSGSLIPPSRTGSPVELDDVLNVLDSPTRAALSALINESGIALTGRGEAFSRTLLSLPHALDRTGALLSAMSHDNHALGELVETSDRVVGAIARRRVALGHLVRSADGALTATAERNRDLSDTVRNAPGALAQLRATLARLQGAAIPLGHASDALRASAPSLTTLLGQIQPFADAARPTLRTATQSAADLTRLGRRAAPALRQLRPVAGDLRTFSGVLDQTTSALEKGTPDTLGAAEGWARAIQGRDGAGHLFRNDAGLTGDTLKGLVNVLARQSAPAGKKGSSADRTPQRGDGTPSKPVAPKQRPLLPPDGLKLPKLPKPDPLLKTIPKTTKDLTKSVTDTLPSLLPKEKPSSSRDSQKSLLDFLLGP